MSCLALFPVNSYKSTVNQSLTSVLEPIGLELRATSGNIYLHAQLFTGFMYIAGAVCMWFLRAWKIGELERLQLSKEAREQEIRDGDAVLGRMPDIQRRHSQLRRGSAMSKVKAAKGLWSWQRL